MKKTILLVDDEVSLLNILTNILKYKGYNILQAKEGREALGIIKNEEVDLMLLDLVMPGMDGMDVLNESMKIKPELPVIMITAHGTIKNAIEATKIGAQDFLEKPIEAERILLTIKNILDKEELRIRKERLLEKVMQQYGMVGISPAMKKIFDLIDQVAPTDARVMIYGDTGTGKELVARAIHANSKRNSFPFCPVNCAAIPEDLIESELFGYKKGAFTGALTDKTGKIKAAHKGTLFLDEIGDMSLSTQAKILRVLEEGNFQRLGDTKTEKVDIRVISATNKNLEDEVKENRFREDLLFRLNVIEITIPPLRERKEDIPVLIDYFMKKYSIKNNTEEKKFTDRALGYLLKIPWNGNVREFENFIEKTAILSRNKNIDVDEVLEIMKSDIKSKKKTTSFNETVEEFERDLIKSTLIKNNWNIPETANQLNIERTNFYKKIKKLGIRIN